MTATPADFVVTPPDAAQAVRRALGLAPGEELRLCYLPGPGDVGGSYEYWRRGALDPRTPSVAYSTMFFELARRLDARAFVATDAPPPADPEPWISFTRIARPVGAGALAYRLAQRRYGRALIRLALRARPHVIVASTETPPAFWPALARSGRLILSAHNSFWPMGAPLAGLRARLRRRLLARAAPALSGAVCTSDECRRQIAAVSARALPMAVETPQIPGSWPRRARHIVYAGRIMARKGVFDLLAAFRAAAAEGATLTIAGDGPDAGRLAAAIGDDSRIALAGQLDAAGVHALLDRADLLVCPTTTAFNEGLALGPLEAAAHGVPSLLSSVVPAQDLLGAAAAVYPADDVHALTACLDRLMTDDDAYAALTAALPRVQERLADRSASWAGGLYDVLTRL